MQSIQLPDTLREIGRIAFVHCKSLLSVYIPASVKEIAYDAFVDCTSLQSVCFPEDATFTTQGRMAERVINEGFRGCDKLRHAAGDNNIDIFNWLCHRFDDLPIHQACYRYGNDEFTTLSFVSTVVQENKQTMMTTDRMGMTCLHILSCNPRATVEVMQLLVEEEPSLLGRTDDFGNTPLQLFLKCRNLPGAEQGVMPSARDLLEEGITGEDLAILLVALNSNRQIDLSSPDEETGLLPFMSAAASPACGLDAVFTFAMNSNLDMI